MRLFVARTPSTSTRVQRMSSEESILNRSELSDYVEAPTEPSVMSASSNRIRLQKTRLTTTGIKEHLRIFCFQNLTSSFVLVVIVLMLKLCMSVLYVIRVSIEDQETCSYCGNATGLDDEDVNWLTVNSFESLKKMYEMLFRRAIIWVQKDMSIWIIEVTISIFTLTRMLIVTYVRFKGNCYQIFTINLCLEVAFSLPFIITLLREDFRQFYIPSFLNCWLAKRMLEQNVLSHRKMLSLSLFTHKVVEVTTTMVCLIFTGLCGVQHIQRGSPGEDSRLDLFQAFYFVMVTFSTVGFGDYAPDIWLLVIVLIVLAIVVLPKEFESLVSTWMEHQRTGGSYVGGGGQAGGEMKHVVFYGAVITDQLLEEFLNEFFSHRHLQDYYVVFMSMSEPDQAARRLLQSPLWLHRVMFIRGSLLRDSDLARSGMKYAKACFLVGNDSQAGKHESDQKTILRSWSMRDYALNVPLYVQIYRPESGVHLKFAKFAVCEEEFKFAMLAYNCLVPGTSTMLSLLLHSSTGEEGQNCTEPWLKLYGRHSGNEIYSIRLSESLIFCDFEGTNFTIAALYGHRNYGVALIGVQTSNTTDSILLNPGFSYLLKATDQLFYLSINREEEMSFDSEPVNSGSPLIDPHFRLSNGQKRTSPMAAVVSDLVQEKKSDGRATVTNVDVNTISKTVQENPTTLSSEAIVSVEESSTRWITETEHCELRIGILPVVPYIGIPKAICHLRKEKKSICCMSLDEVCKHCSYSNIKQYAWANRAIILVAEMAGCGFFNFIIPLRVAHHPRQHLRPIVIMLEKRPDDNFLDVLAWFPLVYWMTGSLNDLDSVLTAGVNFADNVVILRRDGDRGFDEDDLADCATIVAVQSLQKYFSDVKFTTELSQTSSMRFVHFDVQSELGQAVAMIEKKEKQKGSSIPFMFRTQFAEGSVYNSSMLNNLLYQAFLKDYLIPVVRGLLGLVQTPGSGFLTSVAVAKNKPWATTYGTLFTYLSVTTGDVPVAVFRTQLGAKSMVSEKQHVVVEGPPIMCDDDPEEADEINNLVKNRLARLGLSKDDYEYNYDEHKMISYVVINPDQSLPLDENDIVFVIRPSQVRTSRNKAWSIKSN